MAKAQTFLAKYDRSRDEQISTKEDAYNYCQRYFKEIIGEISLPGRQIDDNWQLHYKQGNESVPGLVGSFVLLFYLGAPGIYWDYNCEQIIAMIDEQDLANVCQKSYVFLCDQGWQVLAQNKEFFKTYCRFALPAQIRELKEQLSIWQAKGVEGVELVAYITQALALNKSLSALLLLDKLAALDYAATIRGISIDKLRESLIPDLGFDDEATLSYDLGERQLQVNITGDLSIELVDQKTGGSLSTFPLEIEQEDSRISTARREFNELKEMIKDIRENQLAFLKRQFIFGITRSSESWEKIYRQNPLLRKLAAGIVWRCNYNKNQETFMINEKGELINAHGTPWQVPPKSKISLAHPLYLTSEEMDFWITHLIDQDIKQPIAQLSEAVIPFSSAEDIKNRYMKLKVTLRMLKLMEEEGFKIYGISKFGYELDNDIVRLHFDFGLQKALHEVDADDLVFVGQLEVINLNRTRPINHSLAVLDRLAVMAKIKEDHLSPLIEYIEARKVGLADEEINQFLAIANHYQSFNCTAYLLNYKNRKSKFGLHHSELWL